jgi:hypothetical protein
MQAAAAGATAVVLCVYSLAKQGSRLAAGPSGYQSIKYFAKFMP